MLPYLLLKHYCILNLFDVYVYASCKDYVFKEKESIEHEQVVLVNIKVICHDMYKSGKKLFFVLLTDLWLEALVEGNFHY